MTFHQFPLLPPELRNIIWDLALPAPVVYDIYPASSTQTTPPEQGLRFVHPFSEPPPALAAVCRESRSLTLHRYRPLTLDGTTKYVDLRRDILLLESSLYKMHLFRTLYFMGRIPLIRENLRSLAFGTSYGTHTGLCHPVLGWQKLTRNNMGRFLQRLTMLKRLETLVFVIHQEAQFALPSLPPASENRFARDGQMVLNATLYAKGSTPPRARVLERKKVDVVMEDGPVRLTPDLSSSSSKASRVPVTAEEGHFQRVPWTGEKPGFPHVSELYYYPVDTTERARDQADAKCSRLNTPPTTMRRGAVPADEDWQQFKKKIKHDLETGLQLGLAEKIVKTRTSKKRKQPVSSAEGPLRSQSSKRACLSRQATPPATPVTTTRRGDPASSIDSNHRWTIEGASLLWRYTMPSLPGF